MAIPGCLQGIRRGKPPAAWVTVPYIVQAEGSAQPVKEDKL